MLPASCTRAASPKDAAATLPPLFHPYPRRSLGAAVVGHQPLVTRRVFSLDHHRFLHRLVLYQPRLDLSQLDAVSPYLHLMVHAAPETRWSPPLSTGQGHLSGTSACHLRPQTDQAQIYRPSTPAAANILALLAPPRYTAHLPLLRALPRRVYPKCRFPRWPSASRSALSFPPARADNSTPSRPPPLLLDHTNCVTHRPARVRRNSSPASPISFPTAHHPRQARALPPISFFYKRLQHRRHKVHRADSLTLYRFT